MHILAPLEFLLRIVFENSYKITNNYGLSLIIMSIVITVGTYPLYYLADIWKEKEKTIQDLMSDDLNKIKVAFTGQKRFYLTQTTYRIFHYKSWYAFRTSLGILIQIPFFFAAYNVLSNFKGYEGVGFLFIKDLSAPDSLLGSINILPFIMTLFNVISSIIYTKSLKLTDNEQQFVLAGVFLLLLYNSPSALLIYWSFNNFLSIFKSLIRFIKNKESISLDINISFFSKPFLIVVILLSMFISFYILDNTLLIRYLILLQFGCAILSIIFFVVKNKINRENITLIICYGLFLFLYLSKSTIISRSCISALTIVSGFLLIYYNLTSIKEQSECSWFSKRDENIVILSFSILFFILLPLNIYFSNKVEFELKLLKLIVSEILIFLTVSGILILLNRLIFRKSHYVIKALIFLFISYFMYSLFFKLDYGLMSEFSFQKDYSIYDTCANSYLKDFLIVIFIIYIVNYLTKKKIKIIIPAIFSILFIYLCIVSINAYKSRNVTVVETNTSQELPENTEIINTLSLNQKNVIFYMSDMMNGNYFGRYLEENPEAEKILNGFVWYEDTLSIASATINTLPVMYGGLSYTPEELNKIDSSYIDKVLPGVSDFWEKLLSNNFRISNVTEWAGLNVPAEDLINKGYDTKDYYIQDCRDYVGYYCHKNNISINYGDEKTYLLNMLSIFMVSPNCTKKYVYDNGKWNNNNLQIKARQKFSLVGISYLSLFPNIATVKNTDKNCFLYILGSLTHDPYGIGENGNLITSSIELDSPELPYYSAKKNIDEFIKLLDFLKENDIYDNTMIILCSDHGNAFFDNSLCNTFNVSAEISNDLSKCYAMLLTKNFNANDEFVISNSYMQNSDVYYYLEEYLFNDSTVFSDNEHDINRKRLYYACNQNLSDYQNRKINTYNKYVINGSIFDKNSWDFDN